MSELSIFNAAQQTLQEEETKKIGQLPPKFDPETGELIDENEIHWTNADIERFVQAKRLKVIKAYNEIPDEEFIMLDPDRQANYLATLRDLEKQVHTSKKFALDEKKLKQDEASNEAKNNALAEIIINAVTKERHRITPSVNTAAVATPHFDPSQLPKKILVPGETDIGDQNEKYEEFADRLKLSGHQDPLHNPDAFELG